MKAAGHGGTTTLGLHIDEVGQEPIHGNKAERWLPAAAGGENRRLAEWVQCFRLRREAWMLAAQECEGYVHY